MFEATKFNWERENSNQFNNQRAPFEIIYKIVKNQLVEEHVKKAGPKKSGVTTSGSNP